MKQHSAKNKNTTFKPLWLIISVLALVIIMLLPTPDTLPFMAKSALAILLFAVILWVPLSMILLKNT